ncbi:methionine adenosyltransferase 2 subunit beta-like [Penaeus chinensis]|uniref:methionine adenosyltransferase 2 subunit beta-like n=1 Tax=Penaeus chinensis TaxID=139456 RepID=UPI001FB7A239|nr:methionine adenosyltransferase 2 subunit beta-like [Penaeus chinensis]XP_047469531.1 methionine adenosyltransferase 2 subunit beta-like [Penaeus chinensis]XP_047469538.1 methionine adenosyltransferase 2 subunit beta-like [Penaeus chinensis]XP_047469545.1 methionine adenosyltransferase 2 subunit beta-like [Penaeus chinensis]
MSDATVRVLVTGGSGLLGRAVMKVFKEKNWNVLGTAFSRVSQGLVKCDLTDSSSVEVLIDKEKPDFIIHAAAERAPDAVENRYEETRKLNVAASGHLAAIAKRCGSKLIYISTDYVFDGTSPPYRETDACNPLNKYGQTKLDGEKAILKEDPSACILRVPILYGPVEKVDESAVTCLLPLLQSNVSKKVSHYEKRYPVHVRDVALVLRDLVSAISKDKEINGIFQWSGKEQLTKYDMIVAMARVLSLPHDHITPDPNPAPGAPRPHDAQMDSSRLESLGISHHTAFDVGIKECLSPWLV